jgi:tetratricopeptide (TPR) repeat protein
MKSILANLLVFSLVSTSIHAQDAQNIKNVEQYIHLGDSLSNAEKTNDNARIMYRKAIKLDPNNSIAYHKYGRSFLGDYFKSDARNYLLDSTIIYENKARSIDPQYVDAYWNEVIAYRAKWRHGMTRKVLMEAIQHLPDDPEILMLLGRNYFDTGNPGLALPYLEKSIEIGGANAPGVSYRFAGWCWFYLEQHEKQLDYFNQFREIDPKSLMGIAGQVHSYTGLKNFDKATQLAIQIKEENPDYDYKSYLEAYIGETYLFAKKLDEAIPYYKKALQLDSLTDNLFATRAVTTTLGYILLQKGQEGEGIKLVNRTIERRMKNWEEMPERWEFSFDIASAYAAMGDLDNAYQWLYTSVITGYPGHLWKMDPVFSECHEDYAFQQLVKQARIRIENEYGK